MNRQPESEAEYARFDQIGQSQPTHCSVCARQITKGTTRYHGHSKRPECPRYGLKPDLSPADMLRP